MEAFPEWDGWVVPPPDSSARWVMYQGESSQKSTGVEVLLGRWKPCTGNYRQSSVHPTVMSSSETTSGVHNSSSIQRLLPSPFVVFLQCESDIRGWEHARFIDINKNLPWVGYRCFQTTCSTNIDHECDSSIISMFLHIWPTSNLHHLLPYIWCWLCC